MSSFNYLGKQITFQQDLEAEVKRQVTKASRLSGCLSNEPVSKNKRPGAHIQNNGASNIDYTDEMRAATVKQYSNIGND